MSERSAGILRLVLGALIFIVAAFFNYHVIQESYGQGPPYYSRTTNMDKWSNPLPELLVGDLVVVFVVGLLVRAGIRKIMASGQEDR